MAQLTDYANSHFSDLMPLNQFGPCHTCGLCISRMHYKGFCERGL